MQMRLAEPSDLPTLAALYRQTVLVHGPQYYNPAQTQMWAAFGSNSQHFRQFILGVTTYVAEDGSGIIGFAGISEDGYVASTYVRHDNLGQGVGSALITTVLNHGQDHHLQRLYAEASELSLGLFKKFGFRCYDTEVINRQGVGFKRYLVELILLG